MASRALYAARAVRPAVHPQTLDDRARPSPTGTQSYTPEEVDWLRAVDAERRRLGRTPTLVEVLALAVAVGYRKVLPPDVKG